MGTYVHHVMQLPLHFYMHVLNYQVHIMAQYKEKITFHAYHKLVEYVLPFNFFYLSTRELQTPMKRDRGQFIMYDVIPWTSQIAEFCNFMAFGKVLRENTVIVLQHVSIILSKYKVWSQKSQRFVIILSYKGTKVDFAECIAIYGERLSYRKIVVE